MKNQRGFATVALLALLPLFMAILAVTAGFYLVMRSDGITRHVCRAELLAAQKEVASKLKDLMALNKKAARLRRARKRAEIAVSAARVPILAFPAKTYLEIVKAQQFALAIEQKRLISAAKLISFTAPGKASRQLERELLKSRSNLSDVRTSLSFRRKLQRAKFSVIAVPKDSMTPDYYPSDQFSSDQMMGIEWSFDIKGVLPDYLWRLLQMSAWGQSEKLADLKLKASCGATLTQGNLKGSSRWEPKLKAAKPSLNL